MNSDVLQSFIFALLVRLRGAFLTVGGAARVFFFVLISASVLLATLALRSGNNGLVSLVVAAEQKIETRAMGTAKQAASPEEANGQLASIEAALPAARKRAEKTPGDMAGQLEVADSLNEIAHIRRINKLSGSFEAFSEANRICSQLSRQHPENIGLRRCEAFSSDGLGAILYTPIDETMGQVNYLAALNIRKDLALKYPNDEVIQGEYLFSLTVYGNMYKVTGEARGIPRGFYRFAAMYYKEGLAHAQTLQAGAPDNPKWKTTIEEFRGLLAQVVGAG